MELPLSDDMNKRIIELMTNLENELIKPRKENISGPPESRRLFGEKEHPRNGEPFDTCDESDEWSVM